MNLRATAHDQNPLQVPSTSVSLAYSHRLRCASATFGKSSGAQHNQLKGQFEWADLVESGRHCHEAAVVSFLIPALLSHPNSSRRAAVVMATTAGCVIRRSMEMA